MLKDEMTEQEKQIRREYHRKWRAEHPENVIAAQCRYWERKIQERNRLQGAVSRSDTRDQRRQG